MEEGHYHTLTCTQMKKGQHHMKILAFCAQILVVGPSGCGKSECIKTFAVAEKERGKIVNIQSVFTKAVESQELMGYVDPKTKYVCFRTLYMIMTVNGAI